MVQLCDCDYEGEQLGKYYARFKTSFQRDNMKITSFLTFAGMAMPGSLRVDDPTGILKITRN